MLITIDIPEVRYPEIPAWLDERMQQIDGRVEEMTIADNVMAQVEIQMARAMRDKKAAKRKAEGKPECKEHKARRNYDERGVARTGLLMRKAV